MQRRSVFTIPEEDDDDKSVGDAYDNGHWEWDLCTERLEFVSDLSSESDEGGFISYRLPVGTIEFRDDVDVIEQMRFRRRFQRKAKRGDPDVVTLQDLIDVVLFTAPKNVLTPKLINILHVKTTERLIRALILYCQYYLQIADEMERRTLELETKIRSINSDKIEQVYRDNLNDLRVLAAKEYTVMLTGGESKKYHHMGPQKKSRSLNERDARLFKILVRVVIQIIWLALGRNHFNRIELEVNRLFKSDLFNSAEHTLKTGYITKMTKEERNVLLGPCIDHTKLKSHSPVTNELYCKRIIDYRLLGLGVIKYPDLPPRLKHLLLALAGPEEDYIAEGVTVGILGLKRNIFDTMMNPRSLLKTDKATGFQSNKSSLASVKSKKSEKVAVQHQNLYPDIALPPKENDVLEHSQCFSATLEVVKIRPDRESQRRRWLERLLRIMRGKADSRISYAGFRNTSFKA